MGFLIDTSIFIAVERDAFSIGALEHQVQDQPAFMSVVTVSELWHGVHRATSEARAIKRSAFIEHAARLTPTLEIDEWVAKEHARLWADLESHGQMIGVHDLWIAATARVYDLAVATRNSRDFNRVPGLRVEVW